jgi:hypothetical protein
MMVGEYYSLFSFWERVEVNNESKNLIISVKEARKLLGKDGEQLADDQIEHLIITLTEMSSVLLNQDMVPKIQQANVQ